jgi:hypothetical protein
MDKLAQKRSILDKYKHPVTNVTGLMAEKFFAPELKRVMGLLNNADDSIRSILTGTKIGTGASPEDKGAVKELLKSARTNYNRREYMSAISDLGRFHKKMADATKLIQTLNLGVDRIHHDFLFQGLNTEQKSNIQKLREHMGASVDIEFFIKEAGIMDFYYNNLTHRGTALKAWEKRYPNVVKRLRDGLANLLDNAESLLSETLGALKEMSIARSGRLVDKYVDEAKKISNAFTKFDNGKNGFKPYYNEVIKPFLDKQDEYDKEDKAPASPAAEVTGPSVPVADPSALADQPVGTVRDAAPPMQSSMPYAPPSMAPPSAQNFKQPEPSFKFPPVPTGIKAPPSSAAPFNLVNKLEQKPTVVPPVRDTSRSPAPAMEASDEDEGFKSDQLAKEMWGGKAAKHYSFIKTLESFAGESPLVLAGFISKYAKKVQSEDPEIAIRLFKIVKNLRG